MKQEIEINEWIESYLNGDLPAGEVETFRKKLEEDPGFAREVELHRQLREIVSDGACLRVKNELKTIHLQKIKVTKRIKRITGFGLGALIIGGILLLVLPKIRIREKDRIEGSPAVSVRVDSNAAADLKGPLSERIIEAKGKTNPQVSSDEQITVDQKMQDQIVHTDTLARTDIIRKEAADENQRVPTDKPVQASVEKDNPVAVEGVTTTKPDCRKVKIVGDFMESESCSNKPTGSILIDRQSVTGGLPPYTFSINQVNFRDTLLFSNLYPASYPLYAKDANNCVSRIGIALIRSVDCVLTYQAVFEPMKGVIWTVPTDPDKDGKLSIFSKNGDLVYSIQFSRDEPVTWSGTTLSGQALPMGVYLFRIEYTDEEIFSGNVTIKR